VTWRKGLRKVKFPDGREFVGASFRGVPFFVDEAQRSGGRRTVVHEFPLRDDPFVEDLGRRARKFPVTGYVIGDDYLAQKNELIDALESTSGPGELILPYWGGRAIRAICDTVTVSEKRAEGGMATFTIDFIETPAQAPTPTIARDLASRVSTAATAARAATKAELVERFSVVGLPAFALASAETALVQGAAALSARLAPLVADTQALAALSGQVHLITTRAASLARQPADALDAFGSAIEAIGAAAVSAPGAVLDALTAAYGSDLGAVVRATTSTRTREAANQTALTAALRRVMTIEAARLAPVVPYVSIEDATAARDLIAAQLDEQAQGAGDTAYPALVALRSEVLHAVPGATAFASVVTITRRTAIPSLLLTYQLYGSVDQEADVIARNDISHPGFVTGTLKVLSKARR
jgi:prophage DNA circulation protein